jgi:hypothetical protein
MSKKPPRPVSLSKADFWKLKSLCQKVDLVVQTAQTAIGQAENERNAFLTKLGREHGFDPTATWGLDDKTTSLLPPKE